MSFLDEMYDNFKRIYIDNPNSYEYMSEKLGKKLDMEAKQKAEEEARNKELFKPVNEWDDDYNDKGKVGNTEHDTMGYDYIATPYTVNPIVQDMRNAVLYGGVPYTHFNGNEMEYNCTTGIGKTLIGTPFGGYRSVPLMVEKAKELGMWRPYESGYNPVAADIVVHSLRGNPYTHATMQTENNGTIQVGETGGGGYETDNTSAFGFGKPDGYITTHVYNGRQYPVDFNKMQDDFMLDIYGNKQRMMDEYLSAKASAVKGKSRDTRLNNRIINARRIESDSEKYR